MSTAAQRSLAWGGMVSGGRRSAKVKEEGEERGRGSGGNEQTGGGAGERWWRGEGKMRGRGGATGGNGAVHLHATHVGIAGCLTLGSACACMPK